MGKHVKDRRAESAHADREKHISELAHGGIGENFLDVVLRQRDGRREQRRGRADPGDQHQGRGRQGEQKMQPRRHVDARRDHGSGMDQRAHRRRAGHRVGQPDEQRNLRRFSGGADEQQQA